MEYSIMARLNPDTIYPYICEDDRDNDDYTTFYLKALTLIEYRECEELYSDFHSIGGFGLRSLKYGLKGWDNFTYENGEVIPFDFKNISAIPYKNQLELYGEIMKISEPDEELVNELKFVAKWSSVMDKLDENKLKQWDCVEYCSQKKGLQKSRNCEGNGTYICKYCKDDVPDNNDVCEECGKKKGLVFKYRFSDQADDYITRCPVGILTSRSLKLTNIVNYIDNSKSLPFNKGAMEQTYFYYMARSIVLSEQNSILKKEMDQMKKDSEKGRRK